MSHSIPVGWQQIGNVNVDEDSFLTIRPTGYLVDTIRIEIEVLSRVK